MDVILSFITDTNGLGFLWGILIFLAPIGIWRAKSRLTKLEARTRALEIKLGAVSLAPDVSTVASATPADNANDTITAATVIADPTPEPTPKVLSKTPAYAAQDQDTAEAYIQRREKLKHPSPAAPAGSSDPVLPEWILRSLTGGRLFVTLGLVLLFIGAAMLFKYAAHYIEVPIEARFIGVGLAALAMIAFGHKQIGTRRDYGLYLQGGGLGLLFLTVFSAFKFYALISPTAAFALLIAIGAATFALSIKHNTMALSVLAVTGGFLAPLLTSTGQGSHIALFSYYLLLNLVIFAIAWIKPWRVLNTIGFAFTFVIGLLWGGQYYVPEFYPSVQAFLILYFLLYVSIGILFASRSEPQLKHPVDVSAIFGTPLIGLGLQLALVKYFPDGQMMSCIVLGAFYAVLCVTLKNSSHAGWKLLSTIFMWLSLLFFTLAIPLGFSAKITSTLWAIEGVALLWMHTRTRQPLYGGAGMLVLAASNVFTLFTLHTYASGTPFLNGFFVSAVIMAITHVAAGYLLMPVRTAKQTQSACVLFSHIGLFWWFGAGMAEVVYWLPPISPWMPWLLFFSVSAFAGMLLYSRFAIPALNKPITLAIPALIGAAILQLAGAPSGYHPAMEYGYLALPVAFALHYLWLARKETVAQPWQHILAYIALVVLAGFELGYHLHHIHPTNMYKICGWLLCAVAGILVLSLPQRYRFGPLVELAEHHAQTTGMALISWALVLCVFTFPQPGAEPGGWYFPLLNLVELAELLTIAAFAAFRWKAKLSDKIRSLLTLLCGGLVFILVNCLMLRTISHNTGLIYFSDSMFDSVVIQTALTILWTLIAMATMMLSSKQHTRFGWFAGAALLGTVVIKLFIIDLAGSDTLSRIISFMAVGALTLVLGYLSPMPPKHDGAVK